MHILLRIELPEALAEELEAAARECRITPEVFAGQAVEGVMAERRLAKLPRAKYGVSQRRALAVEDMT